MTLRITGGEARGRQVASPKGRQTRPTAAKIRQAVFNILGTKVKNACFLDLFAGSGIMGIEALSRGAAELTAIEASPRLASDIKKALSGLSFEGDILVGDVREVLGDLPNAYFDIIFADPPYQSPLCASLLHLLSRHKIMKESGILMVEHAKMVGLSLDKVDFELADRRDYGQSSVSFFRTRV